MAQFIASLIIFIGLHSIPALHRVRHRLVQVLGRRGYLVAYSAVSLAALGWVFHTAFRLDYVELWAPHAWHAWFPLILTPIGLFFLIAGLATPNPMSVSLRGGDCQPGAMTTITRHPVLWGFLLWAIGHVIANGDVRSVVLFGVLAAFAALGMVTSEERHREHPLHASTSILPFGAVLQGRTRLRLDLSILVGLVLATLLTTALLIGGHATLFAVDPLTMAAG